MKLLRRVMHGCMLFCAISGPWSSVRAQGTAFTYQGRLNHDGIPANGLHDFQFSLWAAASGAPQVGSTVPVLSVSVTNGLFAVLLDFGPGCFTGPDRWLQIAARTNGAAGYDVLSPRQLLSPAPYAIMSGSLSGVLPSSQLSGTYNESVAFNNAANAYSGSGANLTALNASQLSSGTAPAAALSNAWRLVGNAGTLPGTHYVGTSDNQPLDLAVNGKRALRLVPGASSPNVVGGDSNNTVRAGLNGVVIAGGGTYALHNEARSSYAAIGGGSANLIQEDCGHSVVGGGYYNKVFSNAGYAVVAGGRSNIVQTNADYSAISGGWDNTVDIQAEYAAIGGGHKNALLFNSDYSVIGGGRQNRIESNALYGTVGGGWSNVIEALSEDATIGGGQANEIHADYGTVGGGSSNTVLYPCTGGTIAGGQNNSMQTNTTGSAIGGGLRNRILGFARGSVVGGGYDNTIASNALHAVIGGGYSNLVHSNSQYVVLAGGSTNIVGFGSFCSVLGGGRNNRITDGGYDAVIPGGWNNVATNSCFAAGRRAKAIHRGSFVWGDSTDADVNSSAANSFVVRASGGARFYSNTGLTAGVSLAAGGTAWAVISDRNEKKNFAPVDGREVLDRLAQVPIERWNYRWEKDDDAPHIGPMAQEFKAAFYPGRDDTSITTLEMDGVALAAIQGLNERLKEKDAQIAALEERLAILERQMEAGR